MWVSAYITYFSSQIVVEPQFFKKLPVEGSLLVFHRLFYKIDIVCPEHIEFYLKKRGVIDIATIFSTGCGCVYECGWVGDVVVSGLMSMDRR
jgi:hypothetical protein